MLDVSIKDLLDLGEYMQNAALQISNQAKEQSDGLHGLRLLGRAEGVLLAQTFLLETLRDAMRKP